ncbi:hypothetical protein AAFC00_006663 [Neodothiora populina]|uniref:Heme haloperoxidase family profile domain-containing protein n=1 Tax=Neodothiora populina TaxID=2781224 RepID=A0ABR3PAX0_9PEZI
MSILSLLTTAALICSSAAFPGLGGARRDLKIIQRHPKAAAATTSASGSSASSFPAWHPARPGEVRSPCPGLNSLANHDICPRSGKGYTLPILTACLAKGLNMGADFTLAIGTAGFASNPDPELLYFDLDMLQKHDFVIEHDASLSRADASTGDNHSFNQTIWNSVTAFFANQDNATIETAAKAKFNRVTTEAARDPEFSYGPAQFILSYGETALYLSTMGDPTTGSAPVDYVNVFFQEERLPYEEGWRPTLEPTTLSTLGAMIFELNIANGEVVPEGSILGEHSLRAVLVGVDAITGLVENPILYAVSKLTSALGALTGS